jgi:hypothetical protein
MRPSTASISIPPAEALIIIASVFEVPELCRIKEESVLPVKEIERS